MRHRGLVVVTAAVLGLGAWLFARAQALTGPSSTLPYEGFLENNGVPVQGNVDATFELYDDYNPADANVGTRVWEETQAGVAVVGGRFAVALGSVTPLTAQATQAGRLFLAITVNGTTLQGRQALGSVPYSWRGVPGADFRVDGDLRAGTVTTPGTVTAAAFQGDGWGLSHVGRMVQLRTAYTNQFISSTSSIPWDDTAPEIAEGVEIASVTLTPASANSTLIIDATVHAVELSNTSNHVILALFRDGATPAIAAAVGEQYEDYAYASGETHTLQLHHVVTAGTTAPTTFSIRCGVDSGTVNINGGGGGRKLGGALHSGMTVMEFERP
ncbi:MAG: hypothetical protein HY904_17080 [Deltaproteobacteria bacterium]|nr:hypothetical protein [Deltaproteobacteria bacterium]